MLAEEPAGRQAVHFGKLVVDGDARRDHVAHDHRFGTVAGDGSLASRRIAALLRFRQPDQFGDESLFVLRRQQRIQPVVDDGPRDHHAACLAAGILPIRQFGAFQERQRAVDRSAAVDRFRLNQILQRLPLDAVLR